MTSSADALGITLDQVTGLTEAPSVVVYGPPGSGKSTELALAFQNALFITTARTVVRPYYSYLREKFRPAYDSAYRAAYTATNLPAGDARAHEHSVVQALTAVASANGYRYPLAQVTVGEYSPTDGTTRIGNYDTLTALLARFCQACHAGTNPYSGVVVDEYSTFVARVWSEFQASSTFVRRGRFDAFAAQDGLEAFVRWVVETPRTTGRALGLLCHDAEPKYQRNPDKLGYGSLLYKGGPAMPFGRLREVMTAAPDAVLRITLKDGASGLATLAKPTDDEAAAEAPGAAPGGSGHVERRYWTEAHPLYHTKFRDFVAKPEERLGLRGMLERASYLPPSTV